MKTNYSNAKNLFKTDRLIANLITLMSAVFLMVGMVLGFPRLAMAKNYSILPLENLENCLIAGVESEFLVPSPLLLPLQLFADTPVIDKMPTGEGLNGFMKTSYQWGINTGKKFLGLLLAYKLAAYLFKK